MDTIIFIQSLSLSEKITIKRLLEAEIGTEAGITALEWVYKKQKYMTKRLFTLLINFITHKDLKMGLYEIEAEDFKDNRYGFGPKLITEFMKLRGDDELTILKLIGK